MLYPYLLMFLLIIQFFWYIYLKVILEIYTFLKVEKTINDILLKSLIFQTGQIKWDGGSTYFWD